MGKMGAWSIGMSKLEKKSKKMQKRELLMQDDGKKSQTFWFRRQRRGTTKFKGWNKLRALQVG